MPEKRHVCATQAIRARTQGPLSLCFCETRSHEPSPLLGGAEAEGFGVGAAHEEPARALRATPGAVKKLNLDDPDKSGLTIHSRKHARERFRLV